MNPVKRIGRYQLPILNVVAISLRTGWRAWFKPGYDATLINGRVIHLTEEEKTQLDQEREMHEAVMQVYGMAKGLGLRT
jgi:hypothetical protein